MQNLRRFRWTLRYLIPHWPGLLFVTSISLSSTGLSLLQPYLSKWLIDEALIKRDPTALWQVSGLMVLSSLVSFAFNVAAGYWYTRISARILFRMRADLLEHLHSLSPRFFAEWKTGDILSRLNNDMSEIQRVVADALLSLLGNLGFLMGSIIILVRMDLALFAVGVAVLPLATGIAWWFRKILADRVRQMREAAAEISSFLLNTLLGHRIVAAYGAVARELQEFTRRNDHYVNVLLRMQMISYAGSGLPGMLLAFSTAAVFWVGGNKVIAGTMTMGTLVAFLAYHTRLLAPVQSLMGMYTNFVTAQVSLERVQKLFDVQPEVQPALDAPRRASLRGEVELRNVRFGYNENQPLFTGLSWHLLPGQTGVVLGPSGRGKSTLADLLLHFYEPGEGTILLDGIPLSQWHPHDLREHLAVVEQAPFLFPATIAENLRFGLENITDRDLHEVLDAVSLGKDIPDLNLQVGERGLSLSAGQRQRLAIARALLRRPSVLVLDEPTAALDEASESIVSGGIRKWLPHATIILITHRTRMQELADSTMTLE